MSARGVIHIIPVMAALAPPIIVILGIVNLTRLINPRLAGAIIMKIIAQSMVGRAGAMTLGGAVIMTTTA